MKYIKKFESLSSFFGQQSKNIFNYTTAILKFSNRKEGSDVTTKKFNSEYQAKSYAKMLIEEYTAFFNKENGYIHIMNTDKDGFGGDSYNNLIKWWGDSQWKEYAENNIKNVYIYNKYFYGLEAAYDKFISPSKNNFKILKYIKEKYPDMWKVLEFHISQSGIDANMALNDAEEMDNMGFND